MALTPLPPPRRGEMGEIIRTLFPGGSLASSLLLRRYGLLLLPLCLFLLFFLNLTGALKNGLPGKELWEEASRHTRELAGESGWGGVGGYASPPPSPPSPLGGYQVYVEGGEGEGTIYCLLNAGERRSCMENRLLLLLLLLLVFN